MANQQWLGLGPVTSRPLAPSTDAAWEEDAWNAFFQGDDGSDAWPGWLGDGDSDQFNSLSTARYWHTDQAHVNTSWSKPPDLFGDNDDLLAIRRSPPLAELDVPPPTAWSPGWRSEPVKTAYNSAFTRISLFEGKGNLHWQKTLHCQMLTDSQDNVVGMNSRNLTDNLHWNLLGKAPGALLLNTTYGPHHSKDMQSGMDNVAAITPCSNISVATTLPGMAQGHQSPPPRIAAICPWFNSMSPGQDMMYLSSTPTHSSRTNSTGLSANNGAAQQHLDMPPCVALPPAPLGLDARSRRYMPTKSSPTPAQDIVMTTGNADQSVLTETVQSTWLLGEDKAADHTAKLPVAS